MLRMSIWVHSYAVIHVWTTVNFRENRARLGLKDVAVKWLRLQPLFEYVSHIRIGCIQSVLAPWCVVAEHNMGSLTFYLDTPLQVGGGFWGFGGRPELVWCCYVIVEATTDFRLDPTSILDVYKVFWHLDMLGMGIWGHPYSDTPLEVAGGFWGLGVDLSPCNVVM